MSHCVWYNVATSFNGTFLIRMGIVGYSQPPISAAVLYKARAWTILGILDSYLPVFFIARWVVRQKESALISPN